MTLAAAPLTSYGAAATPHGSARARRVALYYPWIYLTSGAERTILELTARSRHDWTLFTNHFEPDSTFPEFSTRPVVRLGDVTVSRSMGAVASAAWRIGWQKLPVEGCDALVVLCEGVGDLAVFRTRVRPAYCICLTPLRAAFDPEYRLRAEAERGPIARVLLRAGLSAFRAADRRAWQSYTRVFCISEEVKRRALEGQLASERAIEVLHPGIGIRGLAPSDVFDPFFLVPGRIMWTKNIELAIAAFDRFRTQTSAGQEFRLVIAGAVDRKSEPYLARLRARAAGLPVEFRVAPTDAELRELYRTCHAVLFPAFNEDWGIVPIEAMSFGKPVVATDRGGPREIVRSGVEGYLEAPEPAAFAARMVDLADTPSLARSLGRTAFKRSEVFSWDTFTARIDQAIEEGTT
jgi:glycosyltransferase involved in cell wall biosynthesis